MIILNKNMQEWITEKPCDGSGKVICKEILNADKTMGSAETVLFCTLTEGSRVGIHKHEGTSEAWIILQGKAKVWDGKNSFILNPGDANYCEDGNSHGIENIGSGELVYLGIKLPAAK